MLTLAVLVMERLFPAPKHAAVQLLAKSCKDSLQLCSKRVLLSMKLVGI